VIDLGDLPPSIASSASVPETPTKKTTILDPDLPERMSTHEAPRHPISTTDLEDIERATIQRVFEQVKGDKALAGRMLGISRATLYRKLKRYNIGVSSPASSAHTLQ
jgi:transcriptional regulator of acetoin/glycerol metabolism